MKVIAAIDPDPVRLAYMQTRFDVPAAQCYRDMRDVLKQGRIADCVIDATMDQYHLQTALPFLEQGYDMLLEKPLVNNERDLLLLRDTAKKSGSRLTVCHVLRYTPFYRRIKQMLLDGRLGEIMNIQTSERVGTFHSSVSYLRGKWNRESECGSSLLLAKCCHDIDLLCWLNNTTVPALVASQGGRSYFIPEKAPAGAGTRCLVDCPASVREGCGVGMHMGGDVGLMRDLCARMEGAPASISTTDISDSIMSGTFPPSAGRSLMKAMQRIRNSLHPKPGWKTGSTPLRWTRPAV